MSALHNFSNSCILVNDGSPVKLVNDTYSRQKDDYVVYTSQKVDKVMVDDGIQGNLRKADTIEELFCVSFESNDEAKRPSFKAFFHTVRSKSAKTFIAFTPA